MSDLPDPETTEAELISVDTETVLEQIDDGNPFKELVESLRADGLSWSRIHDLAADAYNPVDSAAYEESYIKIPEYQLKAVVHDEQSTSEERYETYTQAAATEDDAIQWVEGKHGVHRVESTEKVGMVKVG